MTKEECISVIRSIEQKTTETEDYESIPRITSCCVADEIAILERLIEEHFELVDYIELIAPYLKGGLSNWSETDE